MAKRQTQTWLVEFYKVSSETWPDGAPKPGEHIETVTVQRAYAPTRWALTYVIGLRRKFQGAEMLFRITAC
jgi:hypothetical protein